MEIYSERRGAELVPDRGAVTGDQSIYTVLTTHPRSPAMETRMMNTQAMVMAMVAMVLDFFPPRPPRPPSSPLVLQVLSRVSVLSRQSSLSVYNSHRSPE